MDEVTSLISEEDQEALIGVIENDSIADQIPELKINYAAQLNDMPEVAEYIEKLKAIIRRQQKKLNKIHCKLKDHRLSRPVEKREEGTQTDADLNAWTANIAEEVKATAEEAVSKTSFVYEPTSGMYYDYKTGYYYNAEAGMYYDGNSGKYLVYDEKSQQYKFQENEKESNSKPEEQVDFLANRLSGLSLARSNALAMASGWPPCLRVMVKETEIADLPIGHLYVITRDGGTAGREGEPISLRESGVSKIHLHFRFADDKYHVVDVGSRNGSWLNGKRISASLQESDPTEITHGDSLRLGSTTLDVHVHGGQTTCAGCEPGLIQKPTATPATALLPQRTSVRDLKKRFGVASSKAKPVDPSYTDRAEVRRATQGSSHPAEKTETASLHTAISSENKGFKMLAKMGWSQGEALGKGDGISEPVPLVSNAGTSGLGAEPGLSLPPPSLKEKKKQRLMNLTKERYDSIPEAPSSPRSE